MDPFKNIGLPEEKIHPKFKSLRDLLLEEKEIVMDWARDFIDKDGKFIAEFQKTFHPAFWELYLYRIFQEFGLHLDFSNNRPDFIIRKPLSVNIEAVVSEIKQQGRREETRTWEDIFSMIEPPHEDEDFTSLIDEAITRYSNSIHKKAAMYLSNYSKCDWVDQSSPYVIALASFSQINYGKEFIYPIMALLYGYYFNAKTDSYEKKSVIVKPGSDAKIPIGIFSDTRMEDVSAIMFTCTLTLGKLHSLVRSNKKMKDSHDHILIIRHDSEDPHFKLQYVTPESPEKLADGLFIFHNPFARISLPLKLFSGTGVIQFTAQDDILRMEDSFNLSTLPIFSRIRIPKIVLAKKIMNDFFVEVFERFNPGYKCSTFKALDIDLKLCPGELTLEDQRCNLPVTIDLTKKDIDIIKRLGLRKGDLVHAVIKSEVNELGETVVWHMKDLRRK